MFVVAGLLVATSSLQLGRWLPAAAASADIVISQVYSGGGNTGALYNNKYVELFNRGSSAAPIGGWSIQYASATGTGNFSANPIVLMPAVSVPAGGYFLVQLAGGANGAPLPAPDASGAINPAATAGKIILASTATGLPCNGGSSPCSANQLAEIVDLVGYGGSNFYEGSGPVSTLSSTTAALRVDDGCTDSDDNVTDFEATVPNPRNSASPFHACTTDIPTPTPDPTATPEPTPTATATPAAAYAFGGFESPIANVPSVNLVRAGAAVPVKFSLGGYFGLDVIAEGYPASRPSSCDSTSAVDPLEAGSAAGGSGLSYDAEADVYTLVWKTPRAWAGSCRTLALKLADRTIHYAQFAFR